MMDRLCELDDLDRPREECGVVGLALPGPEGEGPGTTEAARTVFYGLFALQHRGQEAAGIATTGGGAIHLHKDQGLVSQVFRGGSLDPLAGHLAIGHTRYSTTGNSSARNAQPFVIDTRHGPVAVAHNGNITNAAALRKGLLEKGIGLSSASDSELLAMNLAGAEGPDWPSRLASSMELWEGAFSLLVLTREAVYALRDPWGFRPLAFAALPGGGQGAASESSALRILGASSTTEVPPGSIVELSPSGVRVFPGVKPRRESACSFEYIYFSRPDSVWKGRSVHAARRALGEALALEAPAEADLVIPVPDSAIPPAIGYAAALGLPYEEGLVKNRYIGRTFIEPTEALRRQGVALKFNTLPEALRGKRVVVVDDSIVRGTTTGPLVAMLRSAGASEVHLRIACPPIKHPCFMGVDMGKREELIASRLEARELAAALGADSLAWLSREALHRAIGTGGLCDACFSGDYPVAVDEGGTKTAFEGGPR